MAPARITIAGAISGSPQGTGGYIEEQGSGLPGMLSLLRRVRPRKGTSPDAPVQIPPGDDRIFGCGSGRPFLAVSHLRQFLLHTRDEVCGARAGG